MTRKADLTQALKELTDKILRETNPDVKKELRKQHKEMCRELRAQLSEDEETSP